MDAKAGREDKVGGKKRERERGRVCEHVRQRWERLMLTQSVAILAFQTEEEKNQRPDQP